MLDQIRRMKLAGTVIGITFSSFDLLHAGHCSMLSECKETCAFLIAGLQTDPTIDRPSKNKPVQSVFERWVQLQANEHVNMVIPYATEADLINMLHIVNPNIRYLGEEYKDQPFTGKGLPVEIVFNKRNHLYSTTDLRQRIIAAN